MEENSERPGPGLRGYWLRIRGRRWWLLSLAFAGWLLATTLGWMLPPKYRSETLILVEQQKIPEHYVEPNIASDLQHRLQSMSEQILSRTRLLALIDNFQLYSNENSRKDPEALIERTRKNINIELVRTTGRDEFSSFKISYSDSNPLIAQQVTRELTSLFIGENLRNRTQASEDTTAFLETQLAQARKSLDEQEQRLREYRSQNIGQLPEQSQGNLQILTGLQGQLQSATDAMHSSEQQRLFLQYQYRSLGGGALKAGEKGQPVTVPVLDRKLEKLRDQLEELNAKYTPQHPDVLKVQNEIAATEAQKSKAIEKLKRQKDGEANSDESAGLGPDLPGSSQLTVIEGQLKANELEIANQQAKIKRLEAQIEDYRGRLNRTPVREQQFAAITRDYEQSRTYYESLLAKKLQSEMATDLEKRRQSEQFRMIDPPNLPQRPYWPNRLVFSLVGLGLGALTGLAVIFALELATPAIYGEEELRTIKGLNLLITVPRLLTPAEQRSLPWRRALEGGIAAAMLLVISVGTLLTHYKG